ncbi:MAG: dephospho-CoA kinase [Alicycliphilus sp.]|jgi:dephospho-CoA kinase|uniref:Dephospho-CoA kinase n=1 Tax=Diaphorobacter limosus TaxID=3036128 RepID=A0ABZ0J1C7_9BURK|nr:dephospho-CoA kinase [Diaphorobacter sp. Y-1]MBP6761629.1 dephospho-CoA kinase [Thauera sp.]MBP7325326.1 dephospho-CoA kinase [Alicycliphilus sp.]MBP7329165.1 dephospho-CoA kinase [Alicycliphilus sp.]MBP8778476.1 dephospho-CoA kinase [Alicycliphilus sp.]WOO32052.1 dephospho-CoA kinase [Diaphorobacter sp. Y-1]
MTTTPARPICPRPLRLGVTGGIGSGKSTFAAMLRDCGAALIDADAIARAVTEAGGPAIADIRDTFGADYIDAQGALDRVRMRALVFADAGAKERLEAIVHPLVGNAIAQAAAVAAQAGQRLIVFDIPLLTESPRWARQLDAVLVVDCREESQVARVQARNGLTEDAIRAIMATQSSRAVRRAAADFVVYNDALTLSDLQTKARQVAAGFGL